MTLNEPQKNMIFIDESGNPGPSSKDGDYFVMTAIVVDSDGVNDINEKISLIKRRLGWSQSVELHFIRTRKIIIEDAISDCAKCNFLIYVVIYNKMNKIKTVNGSSDYNSILLMLLKSIPFQSLDVYIDGKYGKKYRQLVKTFLRKNLSEGKLANLHYIDSKKSSLIQFADLVSGSIRQYLKGNNNFWKLLPKTKIHIKRI